MSFGNKVDFLPVGKRLRQFVQSAEYNGRLCGAKRTRCGAERTDSIDNPTVLL